MKVLRFTAVIGFILFGAFILTTKSTANLTAANAEKSASATASEQTASAVYRQNCARCHGADGRGDTELGRTYDTPDITAGQMRGMSNAKLARKISRGGGGMPAFGKKLKAKDINALVGYIRTLK